MKTIILTNSFDATVDYLFPFLDPVDDVFRFNFDLMIDYHIYWTPDDLLIIDPIDRRVSLDTISKVYFRKPSTKKTDTPEESYSQNEQWAVYKNILYSLWKQKKLVLVEPFCEHTRLNKMFQLQVAKNFFFVPETFYTTKIREHSPAWEQSVVKNFTGGQIGDRTIYTSLVNISQLDERFPWFVQKYIEAEYDITVVYVRGKIFAYKLKREFLGETVDFRSAKPELAWEKWQFIELSSQMVNAVTSYMHQLQLDFGRLDFLLTKNQEFIFCEVNPNGQFAWLDPSNQNNLLSTIAQEISPATPVHPIPFNPY